MTARLFKTTCISLSFFGIATFWQASAYAQRTLTKADAPLVVDGTVRQIYTSNSRRTAEALVEVEVQRAEARSSAAGSAKSHFPAPGESVYVHLSSDARSGLTSNNRLPEEGQKVRAYLRPRDDGGWQDALSDWFEPLSNAGSVARGDAGGQPETRAVLGMTIQTVKVGNRNGLRVMSVERLGAAQAAGLEVGDTIVGIDGADVTSADQLVASAATGKKFPLAVIDVNSGRTAQIEIEPGPRVGERPAPGTLPGTTPAPPAAPPAVSLGISAEAVALGTRSALKITRVDPSGIGAKAGLEVGDVVVAANGVPTTGVEQLISALRKSGSTLNLTVRDSRTGRDTEVVVKLSDSKPPTTTTPPGEASAQQSPGRLGAVTELAFHESDFAVKVTEVVPGSAAARAGLRPGLIIVSAEGKPVLHPNDLNDQVRNSQGTLRLSVIDPTSGRQSAIDVNLWR